MALLIFGASFWLEYGGNPQHTSLQTTHGAMNAAPDELWSVGGNFVVMGAVAGDIDGDDTVEVLAGNNSNQLVWVNGITGAVEHIANLADYAFVGGELIGDIDPSSPGWEAVASSGWTSAYIHFYDSSAAELWRASLSGTNASAMHAADADGDGVPELFVADGSNLYSYEIDGSLRWSQSNCCQTTVPAIADIDGDGALEVAVHRFAFGTGYTRVFDANTGALEWEASRPEDWGIGWAAGPIPTIADVDGDGALEVIDSYADTLNPSTVCYDAFGNEEWSVPVGSFASPSVADLDGDGSAEVVLVGGLKRPYMDTVFVYSIQGGSPALLWTFSGLGELWRSALIIDIDNDGDLDVVGATWDGYLFALDGPTGSLLWSFHIGASPAYQVIAADLDGDSLSELVVNAYGKLVAYDEKPTEVGESSAGTLRVEAGLGVLRIASPWPATVRLYSPDGRLVRELAVEPGERVLEVPGRGVFFAEVLSGGQKLVKPVVEGR